MKEMGLALKAAVQKYQGDLRMTALPGGIASVFASIRQFQPCANLILSPIELNPLLVQAQAMAFRDHKLHPKYETFQRAYVPSGKNALAALQRATANAARMIPASTPRNAVMVTGLRAAFNELGQELTSASDWAEVMLGHIAELKALFSRPPSSGGSGAAHGRPGKPVKPAPRPPVTPPGASRPPTSNEIRRFIQLRPSNSPERFGPLRIPSTMLVNLHTALTIYVTMKNYDDSGRFPAYYERYAVPARGSVDIGCQVPGPTLQRFEFEIDRCEL